MPKTMKELAAEAINVQNACNPMGLSKGYAEALTNLRALLDEAKEPSDTRAICYHPINKLWASKLHDLAGMGLSDLDRFGEAYAACKKLAGIE
jgi:hypothetical protein